MRFSCKRARLAEVAGLVGQAVSGKSTKKIFECIRLEAKGSSLEFAGTDLEVAVRYTLTEGIVGGNHAAAPSKKWSARDGYGATVELTLGDGTKIYREHRTEDGYMTQHSSTMVIGIGKRKVKSIRVSWPSGKFQDLLDIKSGSLVTATERASITAAPYK